MEGMWRQHNHFSGKEQQGRWCEMGTLAVDMLTESYLSPENDHILSQNTFYIFLYNI